MLSQGLSHWGLYQPRADHQQSGRETSSDPGVAGTQVFLRQGPQQSGDAEAQARPQNWPSVDPYTFCKVTTCQEFAGDSCGLQL